MTALERRCRRLLLAYPAAYRQLRGEEMLGTLLETAPANRSWPPPRDCWAMIAGGLQVRAAQNRRLGTAASLRLAAMLGCVLYLSIFFYTFAGMPMLSLGAGLGPQTQSYPQLAFAAGLLASTAVLVVRPGGRKGVIAAIVAVAALITGTAAAVISAPVAPSIAQILAALLVMAALALLARGAERLPRMWLWPPGLVVAVVLLAPAASSLRFPDYFLLLMPSSTLQVWEGIVFLAFAWIVIDARPAAGVAAFLGLTASVRLISTWLEIGRLGSTMPFSDAMRGVMRNAMLASAWSIARELLAAALVLVLALLSSWRIRRQAAL